MYLNSIFHWFDKLLANTDLYFYAPKHLDHFASVLLFSACFSNFLSFQYFHDQILDFGVIIRYFIETDTPFQMSAAFSRVYLGAFAEMWFRVKIRFGIDFCLCFTPHFSMLFPAVKLAFLDAGLKLLCRF